MSLDASQIDVGRQFWIKPHHLTKQKRSHILPLQPEALDIALELIRIGLPDYQILPALLGPRAGGHWS